MGSDGGLDGNAGAPATPDLPDGPSVDVNVANATIIFLFVVMIFFVILFVGSSLEILIFSESEQRKHLFNFLIKFAYAFQGTWAVALEALFAVFSLYFVNNMTPANWKFLAYFSLASMFGAVFITMEVRSDIFGVYICDFPFVADAKYAQNGSEFACNNWPGRKKIWDSVISFSTFSVGANFAIFLALLKRDLLLTYSQNLVAYFNGLLKKLGIKESS